jgi:hypothetical protein
MTRESRVGCVCDTMFEYDVVCVLCMCEVWKDDHCRSSCIHSGGRYRRTRFNDTFRALQAYNAYPPCSLDLVPSHESRARLSSTGPVAWDAQLMAAPPMRTLDTSSLGMRATHRDSHPKRWTDHVVAQPSQR